MEHVTELLPAYTLGVLDPAEAELVERHVTSCPRCAAELADAQETTGMLAFAAPAAAPPPDLRARILQAVDEPSAAAVPQPAVAADQPPAARPNRTEGWSWWPRFARIAVPVLAVCVIALLAWNISLRNSLGHTNDTVYNSATSVALGNVGTVFVQSDGSATLYADAHSLPAGRTYQAWVIPPGGTPVSAGTFAPGRRSLTFATGARRGDTVAVTVEPAGGSAQPTSKPVAAGTVA